MMSALVQTGVVMMRLFVNSGRKEWLTRFIEQLRLGWRRQLQLLLTAVWDWHAEEEVSRWPLWPVKKDELIAALRPDINRTLARVADAINAAASGRVLAETSEAVHLLFVDLLAATLATALKLRTAASTAGVPFNPHETETSSGRRAQRPPPCSPLMERLGDAIKDVVLDLGADGWRNPRPVIDPLPPISRKPFIKTMRPKLV